MAEEICAIYVDMGTTNTRVWLMRGSVLLAHESKAVGVSDTARDRSNERIKSTLRDLIGSLLNQIKEHEERPACVIAAGMIGSSLGLVEVPHINAPVGIHELAQAARWYRFPEITDLPFVIVPGVRTLSTAASANSVATDDVMRGEETLCLGLRARGLIGGSSVVINLGSHWKAIQLDEAGKIFASTTSLSGELLRAAQTQTVLASSLPNSWPETFSPNWLEAGMTEQRRSGLPRALFCVRLLDLANECGHEDRFAFLLGAFIAPDLDALTVQGILHQEVPVVIASNHPVLPQAWRSVLEQMGVRVVSLTSAEIEQAFLAGLREVLIKSNYR